MKNIMIKYLSIVACSLCFANLFSMDKTPPSPYSSSYMVASAPLGDDMGVELKQVPISGKQTGPGKRTDCFSKIFNSCKTLVKETCLLSISASIALAGVLKFANDGTISAFAGSRWYHNWSADHDIEAQLAIAFFMLGWAGIYFLSKILLALKNKLMVALASGDASAASRLERVVLIEKMVVKQLAEKKNQ